MPAQLGAAAAVPSYGLLIEFALFTLASQKLLYVASYDKDYPQNLKAKMEKRLPLPVAILLPQHASLAKGLDSYAVVLRLSAESLVAGTSSSARPCQGPFFRPNFPFADKLIGTYEHGGGSSFGR